MLAPVASGTRNLCLIITERVATVLIEWKSGEINIYSVPQSDLGNARIASDQVKYFKKSDLMYNTLYTKLGPQSWPSFR